MGRNSRDQGPKADLVVPVPKPPSGHPEIDFGPISMKTYPQERHRADF